MSKSVFLAGFVILTVVSVWAQTGRRQFTPEQRAAFAARRAEQMKAPRPIDALDSVWMEELTWMEIRDEIRDGKTTAVILTGGVESNG